MGGMYNSKTLLHARRWEVYVNEKENLVKGGHLVEVVGNEKKKVLWKVGNDQVVEDPTDHEEIGLWGFDFNLFNTDEEVFFRERSSEFPYLLMLIKLWPGNCMTQLKRKN